MNQNIKYYFKDGEKKHQYFVLKSNPSGNTFERLLELMFSLADSFILVEIKNIIKTDKFKLVLEELSDYNIKVQSQSAYAQTRLGDGGTAKVYYYKACQEAKEILIRHSNSLYDWMLPDHPEDLSFIFKDCYLLASTAHEGMGSIYIYEDAMIDKISSISGLEGEFMYLSSSPLVVSHGTI